MTAGATIKRTARYRFTASLSIEGGQEYLGTFDSEAEARAACEAAQRRYAWLMGERNSERARAA